MLNVTCNIGIQDWESPEINDRHSEKHLRGATVFCICVALYCEVFQRNCAVAVHVGNVAAM